MTEGAGLGNLAGPIPLTRNMLATTDRPALIAMRERARLQWENSERARYKVAPYRPFHEVIHDGAWAGSRAFIIGGGPSLDGFDFNRLRGKGRVIAINKSYLDAPFADVLYFMDNSFYKWVHDGTLAPNCLEAWNAFTGYKVFLNILGRKYEDAYSVRSLGRVGVSNSLRLGLYHGNNSGVGAIGLAVILRANPIYLLGIDCKVDEQKKKSHYHGGYAKRAMNATAFRSFRGDFERMFRFIRRTPYKVINLNPASAVRCFPFSTIDEVLGNGKVSDSKAGPMDQAETPGLSDGLLRLRSDPQDGLPAGQGGPEGLADRVPGLSGQPGDGASAEMEA